MSLLPFDLAEVISTELELERRANDHLLHASAHLSGSIRHVQLDVAGAPKVSETFVRNMPLWIGSMIHEDIHRILRKVGVPYMAEVNMTPWLPKGWGGTADGFFWNSDLKGFVLGDVKSSKGEAMRYIVRDGAKEEHRRQTSVYWHAAKKMGLPLVKKIGILYVPKNDTFKDELIEPILVDFDPIPAKTLHAEMKKRHGRVSEYIESVDYERSVTRGACKTPCPWVTDVLEPVQKREQRVYHDRKTGTWELKLVPHWTAMFCPFPTELCDCSEQGTTKIGTYDIDGEYYPRTGYDHIEPAVAPPAIA